MAGPPRTSPGDPDGPLVAPVVATIAEVLGLEPPTEETAQALLALAGDVAHASERRNAPLTTYLVGQWVAAGGDVGEARRRIRDALA